MDLASDLTILIWSIYIALFDLNFKMKYLITSTKYLSIWGPLPIRIKVQMSSFERKHKLGVLQQDSIPSGISISWACVVEAGCLEVVN